MNFIEVFLIAVGLAMDAFAVSLGVATCGRASSRRATFRLSFHFGLFQFLMPVIGWFAGMSIESLIAPVDHWIAMGLLAFVGVRMIRSGLDPECESYNGSDPTRGASLVLLAIATSIDALAVGLSLAVVGVNIWYPGIVIGVVTSGLSLLGVRAGNRLSGRFGKRMEVIGGVILCLIGLRIVVTHLFGL